MGIGRCQGVVRSGIDARAYRKGEVALDANVAEGARIGDRGQRISQ